jgi:hypothetical protein
MLLDKVHQPADGPSAGAGGVIPFGSLSDPWLPKIGYDVLGA